jgi:hypothetical protein
MRPKLGSTFSLTASSVPRTTQAGSLGISLAVNSFFFSCTEAQPYSPVLGTNPVTSSPHSRTRLAKDWHFTLSSCGTAGTVLVLDVGPAAPASDVMTARQVRQTPSILAA